MIRTRKSFMIITLILMSIILCCGIIFCSTTHLVTIKIYYSNGTTEELTYKARGYGSDGDIGLNAGCISYHKIHRCGITQYEVLSIK